MKTVLLIGIGKFGMHVAEELSARNHQVLAVDKDEEKINEVLPVVTNAQIGDSTSEEFLKGLGIPNFDVCVVTISEHFQDSLETASLLKDLGAKKVIARASTDIQEKFLLRNGADQVIYPEKQSAKLIAIRCASDSILDYIELDSEYAICEIAVPAEWYNRSIDELDIRRKYHINILGIRANGLLDMALPPDAVFPHGSSVVVLGHPEKINKAFKI